MTPVIGWDIGGVNTKVARVSNGLVAEAQSWPLEMQHRASDLAPLVQKLTTAIKADSYSHHAVTMTAELSQRFRTKQEGVRYIIDTLESVIPSAQLHIYTVNGTFLDPQGARCEPILVGASNWHATASIVSRTWRDALLLDIGTTTTDIIPIRDGQVVATGRNDPDRLRTRELVYSAAVRTPVEAIVREVPVAGELVGVSAEGFALAGDVHFWRGELEPEDYSAPTPDGRPVTREFVRERLARIVCADRDMLDDRAIDEIAQYIAATQIQQIAHAIGQVARRHNNISVAVTAGVGSFLAAHAAATPDCVLSAVSLAEQLGTAAARSAPAAAVALLLERELRG